ncbi:MAG: hypothetical protein WC735_04835 [Candidatus Paceibacterota bacterium]|jgi:hypothetical protein
MIKHKFSYKAKGLTVDFNWNKKVTPCKEVKITLGKKQILLSREEFSFLMAVFADEKQMEDIIQNDKREFVSIQRMLKIKTTKDLKAGDNIVFPYTYWIPKEDYDRLKNEGEMVKLIETETQSLIKIVSKNEAAKNVKNMWLHGKLPKVENLPLLKKSSII